MTLSSILRFVGVNMVTCQSANQPKTTMVLVCLTGQQIHFFYWSYEVFKFFELVNWWVFVKCEPKSSQLKETKTYTSSVCVHLIYFIHKFHNLS